MIRHCLSAAALAAFALVASPSVSNAQAGPQRFVAIDDYRNDQSRDDAREERDRDEARNERARFDERDHHDRGDDRGSARVNGTSLTCESNGRGRRYCSVNLRSYEVVLARRIGNGDCDDGRNWGHDSRGVWVEGNCRAEFSIVAAQPRDWSQRYAHDTVVRCESIDERRAFCRTDRSRGVELIAQISNAACIKNHSWGRNGRGIWVDRGCRGDFRVIR
jgi:hypothetical protein